MKGFAPWQQRIYAQAVDALRDGRLGHALLVCGPQRLGKRAVAEALAKYLLCANRPAHGEACGHCRSCQLFDARSQCDPLETRPDGSLAHPDGHPAHPDVSFVGHAWKLRPAPARLRSEIVIDQMRELAQKLTLSAQFGARVAIVDPADAINHAACNALLKTLEEPQPGRYLWLLAAEPARLPATIRSRCQRLEFRLPPRDEALAWLRMQGHADAAAITALDAARGHPGLADAWLRDGGIALRRDVATDLASLGKGSASALDVAQRWAADELAGERLRHAADLVLAEAAGLTDPMRIRKLAHWFDAANRTRGLLGTTVRADLAIVELLLDWCADARQPATGTRG